MSSPSPAHTAAAPGVAAARVLVDVARASLHSGLEHGRALRPDVWTYPASLRELRASFVTLHLEGELRGCVGGLEPVWPLVTDVAEHAFGAGFRDPRFAPLVRAELVRLEVHVSVVSPLEPLAFRSEAELLAQLRPGVDGLVLEAGDRRGTFLPAVWEQLPEPREFLRQLKRKAGLAPDFWSDAVAVRRYTVESARDATQSSPHERPGP